MTCPHGDNQEKSAPESVKELIKKIHTLSLRGVGGEAESAKRKLELLLAKYQIELTDILQDTVTTYEFAYKTEQERRLILQCYVSLGVEASNWYNYRRGSRKLKKVGLDLTPSQYIDLKNMVDYYTAALKKETDRLFNAFVQRHKLYAPSSGTGNRAAPLSPDELEQLMAMMRGLGEKSFSRPTAYLTA